VSARVGFALLVLVAALFVFGRTTMYGWTPWAIAQSIVVALLLVVVGRWAWGDRRTC
jgi:hypothetical protein